MADVTTRAAADNARGKPDDFVGGVRRRVTAGSDDVAAPEPSDSGWGHSDGAKGQKPRGGANTATQCLPAVLGLSSFSKSARASESLGDAATVIKRVVSEKWYKFRCVAQRKKEGAKRKRGREKMVLPVLSLLWLEKDRKSVV